MRIDNEGKPLDTYQIAELLENKVISNKIADRIKIKYTFNENNEFVEDEKIPEINISSNLKKKER